MSDTFDQLVETGYKGILGKADYKLSVTDSGHPHIKLEITTEEGAKIALRAEYVEVNGEDYGAHEATMLNAVLSEAIGY